MTEFDCELYLRNRRIMEQRYPSLLSAEDTKALYLAMFSGKHDNKHVSRLLKNSDRMIAREPSLSNAGFYDAVIDVSKVAQAVDFEEWARTQRLPRHIAQEIRSGASSSATYWEWLIGEADNVWRAWMLSLDKYNTSGWRSDLKRLTGDISQRPWEYFVDAEPHAMSRFHQHDPHRYFKWLTRESFGVAWAIKQGFLGRDDFDDNDPGLLRAGVVIVPLEAAERCSSRASMQRHEAVESLPSCGCSSAPRISAQAMQHYGRGQYGPGTSKIVDLRHHDGSISSGRVVEERGRTHDSWVVEWSSGPLSGEATLFGRVQLPGETDLGRLSLRETAESLPKSPGRMGDGAEAFRPNQHVIRLGDMIKQEGALGGYVESVDRVRGTAKIEQDNGVLTTWPLVSLLHDTKANRDLQQKHNDKIDAEVEARLERSLANWKAL